ncbi:MAG TPA: tetratricopeptide repeat protein [Candidatus Acidoferrales bacterium]|nr:tetratricopeptide repeat protein [Candidatus Acidoferrales bacterium]
MRQVVTTRAAALILLLGLGTSLSADKGASAQTQKEMIGYAPRELLTRPIALLPGVGTLHDPVTTSSKDAQAFYDQGMALVMSYEWIDAARSFHQALRLDPKLAMAWIGLSDAYFGLQDTDEANAAHARAADLADHVSDREKRRIEIRARQLDFVANPLDASKYAAYRKAVEDALAVDPADAMLWILRGMVEEGTPYGHGQGGGVTSIALYEAALARSPDNFVAHHYLAHTYENLGLMQMALEQVEAYARLAPAIPHAHHMVGHILRRIGRSDEAIQQFLEADRLENVEIAAEHIPPGLDWHYAHNQSLLGLTYQYEGQTKSAEASLKKAFSLPAYVDLGEYNRKAWPEFLLSQGRLQEALAAARDVANSRSAMGRAAGHAMAGRVQLAMGNTDQALTELTSAEQALQGMNNPAPFAPYVEGLRGEIMLKNGQLSEATQLLQQIEPVLRRLAGPDEWTETLFSLEWVFHLAHKAGAWDLAEFTASQMAGHDKYYGGTHYALGLVAEHRGDAAAARREFSEAEKDWSHGDSDFPPIVDLHKRLSGN